jgi:hypothetical protein
MAAGLLVVAAPAALADHHFMSISEVFVGDAATPTAEAVEIKAYSSNQNFLNGHEIRTYDAAGTQLDSFPFDSNPPNAASQASYLAMTPAGEAYFGIQADLEMDAATMSPAGGKVCFVSDSFGVIDCVAWGSYSAGAGTGTSAVGTPVSPTGITDGKSIVRDDGGNGLQSTDDTNVSSADFDEATPAPKNAGNFTGNAAGRIGFRFSSYTEGEGDGTATVEINRIGSGIAASVTVDTSDGTATVADNDYTDTSTVLNFVAGDTEEIFTFPMNDDASEEGSETVTVTLSAPTAGAALRSPESKSVTITDNDGPSTFKFSSATYAGDEGDTVVITIVRGGNTDIDASVKFTMSNGTAESADYQGGPFSDTFNFNGDPSGPDVTTMEIEQPLNQDGANEANETVNLALSNASAGAELAAPANAVLTIRDDDEGTKPRSRISRPAHGAGYPRGSLTTFKGSASDSGGSGLKRVDVGLRRNMRNGSCKWWTGSGWVNRACSSKRFVRARGKAAWTKGLSSLLPRSVGTRTRNYTLYSRAVDNAGNVESRFSTGRNANTFEVR